MINKKTSYGSAKIPRYLPTAIGLRYLDCCSKAGWHYCNRSYYKQYENGVPVVLMILTVQGKGWLKSETSLWELGENTLTIVPPNIPIEYGTSRKFQI